MQRIKFSCQKCGKCCRDLRRIDEDFGVSKGLMLFPEEKHLFPREKVFPLIAIGDSPTKIILYQLDENICPHLQDNKCIIYKDRPLICRAFPLRISSFGRVTYSRECPQLYPFEKIDVFVAPLEETALKELEKKLRAFYEIDYSKKWVFDLETKKWLRV